MKVVLAIFLLTVAEFAIGQDAAPDWHCATQAIADAAKTAKGATGFSAEEQKALDAAVKKCMEPAPQKTLEQKLEFHIEQYLMCARVASLKLDDGISDAATVAVGAKAMCHDYLQILANLNVGKTAENWGETLHPGVVNSILAHRVATRSAPAKALKPSPTTKQM